MNTDIYNKRGSTIYDKVQKKVGNLIDLFNKVTLIDTALSPGLIFDYAGDTAPTGYLICNGQAVSRTTYAKLFLAIGTTYGSGDGSTTFNIPDLQTRVSIGVGNDYELGDTGGEETHLLTEEELPAHSHRVNADALNGDTSDPTNAIPANTTGADREYHSWPAVTPTQMSINMIADTGGDEPHNNMQPYIVLNKIIYTGYFN